MKWQLLLIATLLAIGCSLLSIGLFLLDDGGLTRIVRRWQRGRILVPPMQRWPLRGDNDDDHSPTHSLSTEASASPTPAATPSRRLFDALNGDNDVHIIMPTLRPNATRLALTLDSLIDNCNTSFGSFVLHYGVNWNDSETHETASRVATQLGVPFLIHEVFQRKGDVSTICNHVFSEVVEGRYFLRFNDDTTMLSPGWNYRAITALRETPPHDFGLALIHDLLNERIQTHSFVSYRHREIFGHLFPLHFQNWYEDDWMSNVYPEHWRKFANVTIQHEGKPERYAIVEPPAELFRKILESSQQKLYRYCQRTGNCDI